MVQDQDLIALCQTKSSLINPGCMTPSLSTRRPEHEGPVQSIRQPAGQMPEAPNT